MVVVGAPREDTKAKIIGEKGKELGIFSRRKVTTTALEDEGIGETDIRPRSKGD